MIETILDCTLLFAKWIFIGNLSGAFYRFLCSLVLFRNVKLDQHIKNSSNVNVKMSLVDLILGSILEEILFRLPLVIFGSSFPLWMFAIYGFGLAHFFCNRTNYKQDLLAFGEVIGTCFFAYATTICIERYGFLGFMINCYMHVMMNLAISKSIEISQTKPLTIYVDYGGVGHNYLTVQKSLLCNMLRRVVDF